MRSLFIILLIIGLHNKVLSQQADYWQQQIQYKIDVLLNDSLKTLDGQLNMTYENHSPDTLTFIWIHLWPNAYKNDRTAFCEQMLTNGNTDFYFSTEEQKGYINQLRFKVNNRPAICTPHSIHQDIIKLQLPKPLLPNDSIKIETPFHVKLPYNFSRGGYADGAFQITQWYPKPAVYDRYGWHEMSYLDQGEFYSEFGNYEVNITVKDSFVVAATGKLVHSSQNGHFKTLCYQQQNVHDFAWFSDKKFIVEKDSLQLKSKLIDIYAYHRSNKLYNTPLILNDIKNAILSKSEWLGEYPYDVVSVVESPKTGNGGMEYPTITLIDKTYDTKELNAIINHEIGHNWFYGVLASNERQYPWMDEGMNTYYDKRYKELFIDADTQKLSFFTKRFPKDWENLLTQQLQTIKKDQPINTASNQLTPLNYSSTAYNEAALWMQQLEQKMGSSTFDSLMKRYYQTWKFKHPYPTDFLNIFRNDAVNWLTPQFELLNKTGWCVNKNKKKIKISSFFNLRNSDQYHYICWAPAIGYNHYDKITLGAILHNYNIPLNKLRFQIIPLYAIHNKTFNGIGNISYTPYRNKRNEALTGSFSIATFNMNVFKDANENKNYFRYFKLTPSLKYVFRNKNILTSTHQYIRLSAYFIKETQIDFKQDTTTHLLSINYPYKKYRIDQLQYVYQNSRTLYPFLHVFQIEGGKPFIRLQYTGNYFFNFAEKGGLNIRVFAGKFIYTFDNNNYQTKFQTQRYHFNMSGLKGNEDYLYNSYYLGRNEFEGIWNQQISIRDGGFKMRTDLLSNKIGKTDNWLTAINLISNIPDRYNPLSLSPIAIPIRLFLDAGTYADAWQKNPPSERLLYDAGFAFSFFKNILNIYMPILYSQSYRDYTRSIFLKNKVLHNISFSIDLQDLYLKTNRIKIPL